MASPFDRLLSRFDQFLSWLYITRLWGKRCPRYASRCAVCEQWRMHDEVFNGKD